MPVKKKVKKEKKKVVKKVVNVEVDVDLVAEPFNRPVDDALTYLQHNVDLMKVSVKDIAQIFSKQKVVETEVFVPIKLWFKDGYTTSLDRITFHCKSEWIFKYPFTICTVTIKPADNEIPVYQLVSGVGIARKSDKDKLNYVAGMDRSFGRAVSALTAKLNLKPVQHHYKG